jgi:hypothetical protein
MTNGLRNHPGNRRGFFREWLIVTVIMTMLSIVVSQALRAWLT